MAQCLLTYSVYYLFILRFSRVKINSKKGAYLKIKQNEEFVRKDHEGSAMIFNNFYSCLCA